MNKLLRNTLLGAAALMTSAAASADIINVWTVDVYTIFDTNSVVWTGGTGTVIDNKSLRWGTSTGQGRSGLDIGDSPSSKQVTTNGAAVDNVSVTHLNRPITGASLSTVTILSTLTLTPYDPSGTGLDPVTQTFEINFVETPNADNPCANGVAWGSGVNSAGCADIFVIDKKSLNFPFVYDGQQYFISFFEATSGLNSMSKTACEAAGATYPCLGFQTVEGKDTTVRFAAMITTEELEISVPEPGTLALMGAALAGLGLGRRRRKQAA